MTVGASRQTGRRARVAGRWGPRGPLDASTGEPRPGYDAMIARIQTGRAEGEKIRRRVPSLRPPLSPAPRAGGRDRRHRGRPRRVYGGHDLYSADGRTHARGYGRIRLRRGAEKKSECSRLCCTCTAPLLSRHCLAVETLLGGGTVSAVAREWGRRGLRPPQYMIGPPLNRWKRNSVTSVLKNPRIAGWALKVEGERAELTACEVRGEWEPIVPDDQCAVVALLNDSTAPSWTSGGRGASSSRPATGSGCSGTRAVPVRQHRPGCDQTRPGSTSTAATRETRGRLVLPADVRLRDAEAIWRVINALAGEGRE